MKEFLGKIRTPQKSYSIRKQALISMDILLFGVFMGVFSKYLDYRQANLSTLLHLIDRAVDLHNFLGKLAPWIVIAVCIAVYSTTPIRAGINLLLVQQFHSWIFPEKLCPCLDSIYGSIPFSRIFVLVRQRYRANCFSTVLRGYRDIAELCILLFHFGTI